jgi:hypothetical protein
LGFGLTPSSTSLTYSRGSPAQCGYVIFPICCRIVGRRVATVRRHSARHSLDSRADARLPQPDVADVDVAAATAAISRARSSPKGRGEYPARPPEKSPELGAVWRADTRFLRGLLGPVDIVIRELTKIIAELRVAGHESQLGKARARQRHRGVPREHRRLG